MWGKISREYRRDPQCGGTLDKVYRRDPRCGGKFLESTEQILGVGENF